MGNPSLRVNRHGGSTSKTFILEDFFEDEIGQWAKDEVTGEQGYMMMKYRVFGHGTTASILGSPDC